MKILIVEDSPELARMIARYVKGLAREVIIAQDMAHAFAELQKADPFDIVTLDLNLPDSNIESTLAQIMNIKTTQPNCLLVVVTGVVRPEEKDRIIAAGADGYMNKMDVMGKPESFLQTLRDIYRSTKKLPTRYKRNVDLMERFTAAITQAHDEAADVAQKRAIA